MRNFIILFNGHEGSSAIISHLRKFPDINIIWYEPLDNCHLKQPLTNPDLLTLLNYIYDTKIKNRYQLASSLYLKYSDKALFPFEQNKSVGFKMRIREWPTLEKVFKEHNVVVLVLIRQNLLKLGVSKCRPNSMQFKLINGEIEKNPELKLDFDVLTKNIQICKDLLNYKMTVINRCNKLGITCHPIFYEEYCNNKELFFSKILQILEIKMDKETIKQIANQPCYFKKVHSDELKDFITNYDELVSYAKKNNLEKYL